VYDESTGLVWLRSTANVVRDFQAASDFCAASGAGFHVPTLAEYASMLNTPSVPDVDPTVFPDGEGAPYWTSTPANPTLSDASGSFLLVIGAAGGSMLIEPHARSEQMRVGCVRTEQLRFVASPEDRLVASADVVEDRNTRLSWQRNAVQRDEPYAQAEARCAGSSFEGRTWRVPSIAELITIADPALPYQSVSGVFAGWLRDEYWTRDVPYGFAGKHYAVNFGWVDERFDLRVVDDANTQPCCPVRCVSGPD